MQEGNTQHQENQPTPPPSGPTPTPQPDPQKTPPPDPPAPPENQPTPKWTQVSTKLTASQVKRLDKAMPRICRRLGRSTSNPPNMAELLRYGIEHLLADPDGYQPDRKIFTRVQSLENRA